MIYSELQKVETKNRYKLSSTFYIPVGEIKGAVLIVPAMGVTQKYYASFASWLTTQGYLVGHF
jgi:predicted alpha/beta hydrolase